MKPLLILLILCSTLAAVAAPSLPGIAAAMKPFVDSHEIAGAVTVVVSREKILHLEAIGFADLESGRPMATDAIFSIMSMTKPITATAVLMLQDDGKLKLTDPVAHYIPAFANLKTPSGQPANLTVFQLMTHTSGLGEIPEQALHDARTLNDLVPLCLAVPMQFEPGAKWKYCQSGINTAARIVEIASGLSFPQFLETRIFHPLGMNDTAHFPAQNVLPRVATPYTKNKESGQLERARVSSPDVHNRPPQGNAGLHTTGSDYGRFCQMLLNGGSWEGRRYLSPTAMNYLTTVQTGNLPTGFFMAKYGANYGWGIGTCILRQPHAGVAEMLSPGTFGHGGAWGTQAWIDPVRGIAYILMVQRTNFPNSDASDVRKAFQDAAVAALGPQTAAREIRP